MKNDCYFLGDKGCRILTDTVCNRKPCSFFQTQNEFKVRRLMARKRLIAIGRPDLLRKRKDSEDDGT